MTYLGDPQQDCLRLGPLHCCSCGDAIQECMCFTAWPHGKPFQSQPETVCGKCGTRLGLIMDFGYPPIRLD
jgi:hypothetical protein